jgi:Phosphotransferase enzyme family
VAAVERPWTQPEWLAEVRAWIDERVEVTGEIEQPHVRPWSTALRIPTDEGTLWFKAVAETQWFEPGLTRLLAGVRPEPVTELVDVDVERGWMLMRDAGIRLREAPATVEHFELVLPRYAELQLAAASEAERIVELGVPDVRLPAFLPAVEALASGYPELARRLPEVTALVAELAGAGIPESVQHDDLHDGQIFVKDGHYRVLDWGDSCVSHPFHSLTVTLRAAAWKLGLEPGSPALLRMRDAYLEPFGSSAELAEPAGIAYRTGTLGRALAYQRYLAMRAPLDEEDPVPYNVRLFLENGPIGTWK